MTPNKSNDFQNGLTPPMGFKLNFLKEATDTKENVSACQNGISLALKNKDKQQAYYFYTVLELENTRFNVAYKLLKKMSAISNMEDILLEYANIASNIVFLLAFFKPSIEEDTGLNEFYSKQYAKELTKFNLFLDLINT